MTRLSWGQGTQNYEHGLDRGVFYSEDGSLGAAWDGLVEVSESYPDTETSSRRQDGLVFGRKRRVGEFAGTIQAYSYPDRLFEDVMVSRRPKKFHFSYRVKTRAQYDLHLVYNVLLGQTSIVNRQLEPERYSWDFTSKPVPIPGFRPSAHLVVHGDVAYSPAITDLEDILYGTDDLAARMPTPAEIMSIFEENALLRIIDHGDGTWTAIGPDEAITMLSPTEFVIDWPSAVYLDEETYRISSL